MKVFHKMLIINLALALLPMFIVGLLATAKLKGSLSDQCEAQLGGVVSSRQAALQALFSHHSQQMTVIARQEAVTRSISGFLRDGLESSQQRLNSLLAGTVAELVEYDSLTILSNKGTVLASSEISSLGADYSSQTFWAPEKTWAWQPFSEQGQLRLYLAQAITWRGERLGIMLAEGPGTALETIMGDYQGLGESGDVLLVMADSHGGATLVTPSRDRAGEPMRSLVPPEEISDPIKAALAGTRELFPESHDYQGQAVMAMSGGAQGLGWGLVAKVKRKTLFGPVKSMWLWLWMLMLLAAVVAGVAAYQQARKVTVPLKGLVALVEKIGGDEEFDTHLPVDGNDEMADMAKEVNAMINRLRRLDWQQTYERNELDSEVQKHRVSEAKLTGNQKLTELALKLGRLGLWQVDLAKERLYLSAGMQQIYGIEEREMSLDESFAAVAEDEREQVRESFNQALAGEFKPFTFKLERPDGDDRQLKTLGVFLLKDKEGQAVRAVGVTQDVT